MTLPPLLRGLRLPAIASPMFIVSTPELVIAQCKAGIVGSFPALNARPAEMLDEWLKRIAGELGEYNARHPDRPAAPFAVNHIVHRSNARLMHDLEATVRHQVPLIITSLGAREEVYAATRAYGGITLHDIINNNFAHKAIAKGADGLIAVAAGAGGHAGTTSPFALLREIREWFAGPVALSGAIATGDAVLAALAAGADLAYIGSAFIATEEANAAADYKAMIVASEAADIVYTNAITGVHGNYLRPTLVRAGLDPDNLPVNDPSKMNFAEGKPKAWKDIWGSGQGIGAVKAVLPVAALVERLEREYRAARARLALKKKARKTPHPRRQGTPKDKVFLLLCFQTKKTSFLELPMHPEITNRVALVTGASSGLGERFAEILHAAGAKLAIAARRTDRLEALAKRLGGTILPIEMDVASVASIRAAAARVQAELGPIEILVNNAGISRQARLETIEEDDYDAVLDTNLKGAFFMAQAAARQMLAEKIPGRIVNIASIAGQRAIGQLSTYGMSKAGVIQMTHAMAREWGRHGINTNAICPGYIATEISADYLKTEAGAKFVASLPRRRMGEARDLDALLLLLCSGEQARFLNGSIIAADDGFTSL